MAKIDRDEWNLPNALWYAIRVARAMWPQDPDADSVAGEAAWNAFKKYDGRIPWKLWVSRCTRTQVWYTWRNQRFRKLHEQAATEVWWKSVKMEVRESEHEAVDQEVWQMLVEYHFDGWCLNVVARRHGYSVKHTKVLFAQAAKLMQDNALAVNEEPTQHLASIVEAMIGGEDRVMVEEVELYQMTVEEQMDIVSEIEA